MTRRNGVWLAAVVVLHGGCTVAGPRPGEPAPRPDRPAAPGDPGLAAGAEPDVRVGVLVGVADGPGGGRRAPFEVVDDAGPGAGPGRGRRDVDGAPGGAGVEAAGNPGDGPGDRVPGLRPTWRRAALRVDDRAYRGAVLLRPAARASRW
jgi:hypothetical protein